MTSNNPEFYVCNLRLDSPENSSILIKSELCDTLFQIVLFDGVFTWTGKMESDAIAMFSEQLGLSVQEYISECRDAFSTNGQEKGFIFTLKDDTFQWKKESLHMRILFGKISIEKTPVVDTLQKIINEMLCENLNLKEKLDRIQREKMNLMLDNKHLIETLEESNNMKNRMENDLFERFLKVLNSKKEKIKELRKHALLKGKGVPKESDKYECDTEVESESEEEGDKQASSASDKDEMQLSDSDGSERLDKCLLLPKRNRMTPDEMQLSDSDERLNKCLLLPKRNRQKTSLGNKNVADQQKTSSGCDESEEAPTVVPSTSGMKVNRAAFVDSEDELQNSYQPSRVKITSNPKPPSTTMHSPKKHGRFRNQVVADETSKPDSEVGPSAAKVPKIENVSSREEIKSVESDNLCNEMHREPEVCVKSEEFTSSEQVSVRDLIDGLFS